MTAPVQEETAQRRRVPSVLLASARRVVPLGLAQSIVAVVVGVVVCFVIMLIVASQPLVAFQAFVLGSFRNPYSVGTMISIATILATTAFASTVGFRAGAFNIGTEGQLVLGGLAAAVVAPTIPGGGAIAQIVALAAAAVVGALWIAVPTVLRVRWRTNEILTTLMANYIAVDFALFAVRTWFRDPTSGALETPPLDPSLWLVRILPPSQANIGVVIVIALAAGFAIWSTRTRAGRRAEVSGLQPSFAEYLGIRSHRYLGGSMLASGAIAGLAGGLAILGISHSYIDGFSPQYGFLGITVALIGRLRPVGILVAALLYACLITGATAMQSVSDVPFSLVFVLQGILILLITSQRIGTRGSSS
jgi:general nucleoside transport system permease protein